VIRDYPWVEEIQVRWKDVDAFHHVNHAVSISYLEIARANFWRERMGGSGPMDIPFVIAHLRIDYKRPIHLYDRVRVGMDLGEIRRSSFSFVYEVEAEAGKWTCRSCSPAACGRSAAAARRDDRGVRRKLRLFLIEIPPEWKTEREAVLSDEELRRAASMSHEASRCRFQAARTALRHLLSRELDVAPVNVPIAVDAFGRPFLEGDSGLVFSLSHSGSHVALAIGSGMNSLGVDFEEARREVPALRLAERFFDPAGARAVRDAAELERIPMFFRLWTAREAVLKALGTGLRTPLREVIVDEEAEGLFCRVESRPGRRWRICRWEREHVGVLSLAIEGRTSCPEPEILDLRMLEPF